MARRRDASRPRRSWGAWIVSTVLAVLVATVLAVFGLVNASIGNDAVPHDQGASGAVPPDVAHGGTFVDGRTDPARSLAIPPRTVALTFDDGPDPTWTPQVLAVLAKHRVPGTFFVVGSLAVRHPELLRRIRASGSEIGIHTFTHVDLAEVPGWRLERELGETQLAIAGATGETTYLVRPPFSSTVDAIDDRAYAAILASGRDGYVNVFTDVDGEDWQRPGVDAVVRNATPRDGAGATVLLHDAGGDRSQTVAALDRLIPELQARGYRFTTATDAVGAPAAAAPAPTRDRAVGGALVTAVDLATGTVRVMQGLLVGVGVVVVVRLLLTLIVARRHARRRRDPSFAWSDAAPPDVRTPVSVIVPAYNETENIEATLRSILANDHPLEILVVDDGSSDGTAELVESLALPAVRVIRQPNSGKPIALNTGVARAQHDLVIMMDGDTVFQPDTVGRLVAPFADPAIGAVAGNVKVANRAALIPRLQHIEYVVGFGIDRRVQDTLGAITTIPGAAGAFRRQAVLDVGGLSLDTLAEDTDLTIALGREGWRVVYEERAIAWTEAPTTLSQLWRQRYRWTYGTMQAVWKHRRALRERGASRRTGWLGLGHIGVFQVLFPLAAPLVDLFFVYGLIFGDPATTLVLWFSMLAIQTTAAAYAFRLDGEPPGPLWVAPVQQLLYRPLMYAVLVRSLLSAVTGGRVRWQRMQRLGALRALMPGPAAPPVVAPAASGASEASTLAASGRKAPSSTTAGPSPDPAGGRARRSAPGGSTCCWRSPWSASSPTTRWGGRGCRTSRRSAWCSRSPAPTCWPRCAAPRRSTSWGCRLRRLLPPFWVFGLVVVPVMLWHGFGEDPRPEAAQWLFWVLPVLDPPGSAWAADATGVLSYVRTYLWLVLLTPLLLAAWRRRPVIAIAVPLGVVVADAVLGGAVGTFGAVATAIVDASVLAGAWTLGFAHRDGTPASPARGVDRAARRRHDRGRDGLGVDPPRRGRGTRPRRHPARPGPGLARCGAAPAALDPAADLARAGAGPRPAAHGDPRPRGDDLPVARGGDRPGRAGRRATGVVVDGGTGRDLGGPDDGARARVRVGRGPRRRAPRRPAARPRPAGSAPSGPAPPRADATGHRRRRPGAAGADRGELPRGAQRPPSGVGLPAGPAVRGGGPRHGARAATGAGGNAGPAAAPAASVPPPAPAASGPPPAQPSRPVPSAPVGAVPSGPLPRVPARHAGPPSRPGPAVRPGPGHDEEAVTGVVGRAPTDRRRLLSFGEEEPVTEAVDPADARRGPGRHSSRPDAATRGTGRGSHRADAEAPTAHDPGAPSRHRR